MIDSAMSRRRQGPPPPPPGLDPIASVPCPHGDGTIRAYGDPEVPSSL